MNLKKIKEVEDKAKNLLSKLSDEETVTEMGAILAGLEAVKEDATTSNEKYGDIVTKYAEAQKYMHSDKETPDEKEVDIDPDFNKTPEEIYEEVLAEQNKAQQK